MVTQPKSIAMVVVVFPGRPGTSMPTDAVVISASVVSGAISEIAATVVVLPTPNPPATMILTGTGGAGGGVGRPGVTGTEPAHRLGEGTKSTDHSHDGLGIGRLVGHHVYVQLPGRPQVSDEHPGHPQVQPEP